MTTLAGRLVALAVLVALASVLVTGAATLGLYRQGAAEAARGSLAREADVVAATLGDRRVRVATGERAGLPALRRQLGRRDVTVTVVEPGGDPAAGAVPPATAADVEATRSAGTLSARHGEGGARWLVEGRLVDGAAVLLAQPLGTAIEQAAPGRARLLLPLALGLAVGARAGLLLARRLARPLARSAAAARRLSAGERDVRVPPEGPAELADVARALNGLAAALGDSEERQRRFLLDVSHELRTPLTAVAGYAEALADGVLTGPEVPRAGEVIRDEAARLGRRVEDLLALARTDADDFRLEFADVDVAALLRGAAEAWRPRAVAAGIRLSAELPPAPLLVRTDGERLRQAVDALVDNAVRVLGDGDPLVLATRAAGAEVRVEVRDGGPGLAPEDLAVAFDRGRLTERYRGDRPVGSGLGLALVGALARRLGGRAEAAPAAEGGVAFAVVLPAAPRGTG